MKTFDFLPQRYREQHAARQVQWWRLVVVVLFGGAIATAAVVQQRWSRGVQLELALVSQQHAEAELLQTKLAETSGRTEELRAQADLLAYLHHPWPRTRILAAIATQLTPPIKLSSLRIGRDLAGREGTIHGSSPSAPAVGASASESSPATAASLPPAQRDLKRLREEVDAHRLVVEVSGVSSDLTALHEYLASLAAIKLFEKAELVSVEHEGKASAGGTQFKLRLVVRNGYGQTGGPTPVAAQNAAATQAGKG